MELFHAYTKRKIGFNFPNHHRVSPLVYLYKKGSLFVCLFFMHLDRVRASTANLSRNPHFIQEKVEGYFSPKSIGPSPPSSQKTSSISNQWDCSIPFSNKGQVTMGLRGRWVRICGLFGYNLIGWLRTNRNSFFEKFLNLNGIVAKTILEGFLKATRSNLISIRLEIVVVKSETISDKQFNPFRPAIQIMSYFPTGKCCNLATFGRKRLKSLSGSNAYGSALIG